MGLEPTTSNVTGWRSRPTELTGHNLWCDWTESNCHGTLFPTDFKSVVSTYSTTIALGGTSGVRTHHLEVKSLLLYPMSYRPVNHIETH